MSHGGLPPHPRAVLSYGGAVLVLAVLAWVAGTVLMTLGLVTVTVAVSLLLAALLGPVFRRLHRLALPDWAAALLCVVLLLGVPVAIGFLVVSRAAARLGDVGKALAAAVDRLRDWLVHGPAALSPTQVDGLRTEIVSRLRDAAPSITAGVSTIATIVAGAILVIFLVFFLLKDGSNMWRWALGQVRPGQRDRLDRVGHNAWHTLTAYVATTVVVALIDAAAIGSGLLLIGIPLALPLTLLVFIGAFVPLLGATITGAVAVAVALVTKDLTAAILVLAVVLAVQQLEGNVLQPLLMGRAVALHPVVILLSVTAGGLLLGIAGAVIAVPAVAVAYTSVQSLRDTANGT